MSAQRYRLSSQLRFNIKNHLDRLFIQNGLYFTVASGQFDVSGERADVLRRVNGRLYESHVNEWIYENDASGIAPYNAFVASGIYIDNTFHPKGSGIYKPRIDYRNGRVFFDSNVPSTASVYATFSYKHIDIGFPDTRRVSQIFSTVKDSIDFTQNSYPSGFQEQLPIVVIDVQKRISRPFSLGGGKTHDTLVVLHVVSNTSTEVEQIVDILTESSFNKTIIGVDFNKTPQIFTQLGDLSNSYKNYTQLQGNLLYRFTNLFIQNAQLIKIEEIRGVWIARVDWNVIANYNFTT